MHTPVLLAVESAAVAERPAATVITEAGGALQVRDGKILVQIIDEGQGSSGYYPAAVLEQAATDRVFKAGTRMHLDHPGRATGDDLPERSVKDWVAVLSEDARYDAKTRALVAEATVFAGWLQTIKDLAPYVGVSIRAYAEARPDGTLTRLTEALSVDFVTAAGRGGKVLQVLEAARPPLAAEATSDDRRQQLRKALTDLYVDPENKRYVWLRDYDETLRICWFEQDEHFYQQPYEVADDDMTITLTGVPIEVQPVTRYLPIDPVDGESQQAAFEAGEGPIMPNITEAELAAFKEAEGKVASLTAESESATKERDAAIADRDRAHAELAEARKATAEALIGASTLPDAGKERVRALFEADSNLDVPAAIAAEADYIKSVTPARTITGFGATESGTTSRPATSPWGRKIKEA